MSNAVEYLTKFKMFIMMIVYSLFIVAVFLMIDHYIYTNQTKKDLLDNAVYLTNKNKNTVNEYIASKIRLLESVEKSQAFNDFLSDVTIYKDNLSDLFLAIARNQKDIMQIRYLDDTGMERVRVDRKTIDSKPKKILLKNLQDKSDRYYFTSPNNQKDKPWFSNLDLNMENGKVQVPFSPTLRAIQPVYEGEVYKGIIIINFFAEKILNDITQSELFQIAIFDSNRYIVKHFDPKYDWNAYTKVPYDLNKHVKVSNKEIIKNGYYIGDEIVVRKLEMPIENDFFIKYRLNHNYIAKLEDKKFETFLITLIFIFLVVVIFSYVVSEIFGRLLSDIVSSKEKAINASRAKSEFLANMSHEIRTPLNGVLGLIQLTLDTKLDKKQEDYLYKAKSSSNALLTVINDILDYSKIEAGKLTIKKQEFILQNLVDNVTDLFGFKIYEKGLSLKFIIENDVPNILVSDSLRITQILNNLVGNSVKFTNNGEIKISIKLLDKDTKNKKVNLEFCVSDTGIGISEEDLKRLFNAFTQAEDTNTKKYGGTGLGLTITKQLSNLLGGDVRVESTKGVGSKFYFTVNCEYRDNLNSLEIKKFMANKRFLIVDDDYTQIEYLQMIISSWNAICVCSTDGFKAIDLIKKEHFDYVLLDWNMPIINGIDVLKELKDSKVEIPLIIMVTSYEKNDLLNILSEEKLDIQNVVSKPFTPSVLFEEITNEVRKISKTRNMVLDLKFIGKVLLVEDNEVNQLVAKKFLEKFGVTVDIANDGLEGVLMVEENEYDIIFMDLQMPNMDGFEATKVIRQKGFKTPIIALSAAVMQKDREDTHKVGMNKHIAKPIIFDELREILFEYLKIDESFSTHSEEKDEVVIDTVIIDESIKNDENELKIYGLNIEEFCDSTGIDTKGLVQMLVSYYDSNKNTIDLLKSYSKDSNEFAQIIHKLKGSSGNFQLNNIYRLCVDIEAQKGSDEVDDLLDKLCIELELTIESIRGAVIEAKENQTKSDFDFVGALDNLIKKVQDYSFITSNEITNIIDNLPKSDEGNLKKEIKDAFDEKDYEKLEEILLKIKGIINEN